MRNETLVARKMPVSICEGIARVMYKGIVVVEWDDATVTLRVGGFFNQIPQVWMNQASAQFDLGYCIKPGDGRWHVEYKGAMIAFDGDTLVLTR